MPSGTSHRVLKGGLSSSISPEDRQITKYHVRNLGMFARALQPVIEGYRIIRPHSEQVNLFQAVLIIRDLIFHLWHLRDKVYGGRGVGTKSARISPNPTEVNTKSTLKVLDAKTLL